MAICFRRRGARPAVLDVDDVIVAAPRARSSGRELSAALRAAIDRLPDRTRAAFVLRVLDGRSYEQVAEVLGVRAATARNQVMKARRRLEKTLGSLLDVGAGDATRRERVAAQRFDP